MKNRQISIAAISLALLATTSAIFANFDLTDFTKYSPQDKESVIDAVLNWETLTSSQELIKQSIIKERSERKLRDIEHKKEHMNHKHKLHLPKSIFDKMSDDEKKLFLDNKREEEREYRELKNKVIYNLVSWIELTKEQEIIRKEIKVELEEKIKRDEEHKEIREIEEKLRNWEELSDEEETKLEEFKSNRP